MQIPIELRPDAHRTLQEQLFDAFVRHIEHGRLEPGMLMPATRQLACDLGVSRNTVASTYERLAAEGFIEARPPVGTFVSLRPAKAPAVLSPPQAPPNDRGDVPPRVRPVFAGAMHALSPPHGAAVEFDFWVGRPDPRLFPTETWRRLIERCLADDAHRGDGTYGEPAGLTRLRAAVARHVGATRAIACGADEVVITNGIQEGINIVARLLLGPGVAVGMESPGYAGAANVFISCGAQVVPVEVDDEGAVPGTLPPQCALMYLTPAHQYPCGVALSPRRRQQWLAWAARSGSWVIEDDYDSDFCYDGVPLPALKADDRTGLVVYLGTFSKSLAADLRLGYMIVPPELRRAAVTIKGLLTNGSPWLVQAAMAGFIESGEFVHHLRRVRKHYAARRDVLLAALGRVGGASAAAGVHAGMHLLWQAGDGMPPAAQIEQRALEAGVGVYGLRSGNAWIGEGCAEDRWQRSLLFGYAGLNEAQIRAAVERLAHALQSG